MSVSAVSTSEVGYFKKSHFEHERTFFDSSGHLKPLLFTLVTANYDFSLRWNVKYSYITRPIDETTYLDLIEIEVIMDEEPLQDLDVHLVILGQSRDYGECLFFSARFDWESPLRRIKKLEEISTSSLRLEMQVYSRDKSVGQMVEDFARFSEKRELCDVVFVVGDSELAAHKQILSARGPVFASMLECDMLEKKNGRVEVTDVEPRIFQHLLKFIYSNTVDTDEVEDWLKLIVVADKYCVSSLVSFCESRICLNLTVDNVVDVYVVADLVKADALRKTCVNFILTHKNCVVGTEGYSNLVRSQRTDLISDLFCQM